jgi:hypothetical protein
VQDARLLRLAARGGSVQVADLLARAVDADGAPRAVVEPSRSGLSEHTALTGVDLVAVERCAEDETDRRRGDLPVITRTSRRRDTRFARSDRGSVWAGRPR